MKLDLGSGPTSQPGHDSVDWFQDADWHVDLQHFPWPWDDNSTEAVYCSHFVEHVIYLGSFMNEVYRILVPGGVATIIHPYQHSNRAWQDPTHVRALNEDSWNYYNKEWRTEAGVDYYLGIVADFDVDIEWVLAPQFLGLDMQHRAKVVERVRYSVNVVDDLVVKLTKR